tara:strand:+ start:130 stop:855 length:726 start_codon:yes stop_codon:yes gene_type:complete
MGRSVEEQFWGGFNPDNLGGKTLDRLRNDIYSGFKTREVTQYSNPNRWGGREMQTKDVFDSNYYKEHKGWGAIGDKLGININSKNDVRQMFDYVNGYKPPAAAAAPTAPVAAPQAATPAFDQRIADIGKSYAAETSRLTSLMAQQQKDYDTRSTNQMNMFNQRSAEQQASFDKYSASQDKKISNLSNSVANSASQYDPTKNMSTSNNINPALTIQEKGKDLTKGTQRYNRNSKLNITNVNV